MSALPQLQRLADHIGAAVTLAPDAMAAGIKAALHDATAETGWLPPERRRASHEHYARHLVYADPGDRFSILAIVWDRGQMSPIHAHHCWCAVGVYQGMLTETYYREGAAGEPPVETGQRAPRRGRIHFRLRRRHPPHRQLQRRARDLAPRLRRREGPDLHRRQPHLCVKA